MKPFKTEPGARKFVIGSFRLPTRLAQLFAVSLSFTLIFLGLPSFAGQDSPIIWFPPTASSLPAPESKMFLQVTETTNSVPHMWNGISQTTRQIFIVAQRLILDPAQVDGIFRRYNGQTDITSVQIEADETLLRGGFRVPGANFKVQARVFNFEGEESILDSTPITPPEKTGISEDGLPGQDAGDIDLAGVKTIIWPSHLRACIRGRGSNAGRPGPGLDGQDGRSLPVVMDLGQPSQRLNPQGVPDSSQVFVAHNVAPGSKQNPVNVANYGTRDWPQDGTDGRAAGHCMRPGSGARVYCTSGALGFTDLSPGIAEQPYGVFRGGAAGTPTVATWTYVDDLPWKGERWWHLSAGPHSTAAGRDAVSPPPEISEGSAGQVVVTPNPPPWFGLDVARLRLRFASELFRVGALPEARTAFSNLAADLSEASALGIVLTPEADQLELIRQEVETRLHQIDAGMSFFMTPINIVPRLSLEVTYSGFSVFAKNAIDILFLNALVRNNVATIESKIQGFKAAATQAQTKYSANLDALKVSQANLNQLQQEATAILSEEQTIQEALAATERAILADAEARAENQRNKVPKWIGDLGVASALLKMVPATAPIGVAIDVGLQAEQTFNKVRSADSPQDIVKGLGDLAKDVAMEFDALQPSRFIDGFAKTQDILSRIDPSNYPLSSWGDLKKYFGTAQDAIKPLIENARNLQKVIQNTTVTDEQWKQQIANLNTSHPALAALTPRINALLSRKKDLASNVNDVLNQVQDLERECGSLLLTISVLNRQISNGVGQLDAEASDWLGDLARSAQIDLDYWGFLFRQAVAYRLLAAPQIPSNVPALIERLNQIVGTGETSLNETHYQELLKLLKLPLMAATQQILTWAGSPSGPRALTVTYSLSSEELARAQKGPVRINIVRSRFLPSFAQAPRIVRIRWANFRCDRTDGLPSVADIYLYVTHPNSSRLTLDGKVFEFVHRTDPVLFDYAARFDAKRGQLFDLSPAPSLNSLLATILQDVEQRLPSLDELQPFASMSADADLEIQMEIWTSDGSPISLTQAELVFDLEVFTKNPTHGIMDVQFAGGSGANISLSPPDINGRASLTGNATCVYNLGTTIIAHADNTNDSSQFVGWFDGYGHLIETNSTYQFRIDADRTLIPKYQFTSEFGPQLSMTTAAVGNARILKFITFPGVGYRIESAVQIGGPWALESEFTALSGETTFNVQPDGLQKFYRSAIK